MPDWTNADEHELAEFLRSWGVDASAWGRGDAKSVGHLLAELRVGDCELLVDVRGLTRTVRTVWVDVLVEIDGRRLRLVEREQVFVDGRRRSRLLPASLGEKCRVGEDPLAAAHRGVVEELGVVGARALEPCPPRELASRSTSYPGLRTRFEPHWFEATLAASDFRPEGYTERQPDKTTSFVWAEAGEPAAG